MVEQKNIICQTLLILTLCTVSLGWLIQFSFHQTWLCIFGQIPWHKGFYLSCLMASLPLLYSLSLLLKGDCFPVIDLDYQDGLISIILVFFGVLFWYFFSMDAAHYPVHTYGDEAFHSNRVEIMATDLRAWFNYFFHLKPAPSFRAEYMMYPSLAYVPVTLWTFILGHPESIIYQRMFLVINYLAIILTTYLLARLIIKSKPMSTLIALIPMTSTLLIAYTMSFYIEMQYVSVLMLSFWLLTLGIEKHSENIVITAVFVASLAPIIRESAITGTLGIVFTSALWRYFTVSTDQKFITRFVILTRYFIAGLLPFFMYYVAKSNYTDWDKTRTSLSFIIHQDYLSLLKYAFVYLGPTAIFSFIYLILQPKIAKPYWYLFLAAIIGIISSIAIQAIFLPGYMPWTRNYLFAYAQFMVLIILCFNSLWLSNNKTKNTAIVLVLITVIVNITLTIRCLYNNALFHESEVVFNLEPISRYITSHPDKFKNQTLYLYWPDHFPTFPEKLLPSFVVLKTLTSPKPEPLFLSFNAINSTLPDKVNYLLFYYLKNESLPQAFNSIPNVQQPKADELNSYTLLVNSVDPWSQGRNGVILLERKNNYRPQ